MASRAEIAEPLPSTLPADFGEWDEGGGSPQPAGADPAEPAAESGAARAEQPAPLACVDSPRNRYAVPQQRVYTSERAFLDQLISMRPETGALNRVVSAGAIYEVVPSRSRPDRAPDPHPGRARGAAATSKPVLRTAAATPPVALLPASLPPQPPELATRGSVLAAVRPAGKKKLVIAIVSGSVAVVMLLLWLAFAFGRTGRHASVVPPASPQLQAPVALSSPDAPRPSPAAPLTAAPAQPSGAAQPAPAAEAAQDPPSDPAAPPPQLQAQMMSDQLSAPARIGAEMKTKPPADAPPAAFDATGLAGSAATGGILGSQSAPRVQAAPPVIVKLSASVAAGLLVQSIPPVYPDIAKTARVSGTVVLDATVSKAGAVESLRVVSGPPMLRQAALNAVRTWRYRPYTLNNQPTEIETSINVVFTFQG